MSYVCSLRKSEKTYEQEMKDNPCFWVPALLFFGGCAICLFPRNRRFDLFKNVSSKEMGALSKS